MLMKFRATVKNESGIIECPWFVYIESEHGHTVYACRFNTMRHAQRIAAAMNACWSEEGRLYEPILDD